MTARKILVVLGGDPPSKEILKWRIDESDLTIAVDSGWIPFKEAGLSPHILIGDMVLILILDIWQQNLNLKDLKCINIQIQQEQTLKLLEP